MNTEPKSPSCFHCGLPVTDGGRYHAVVAGTTHTMCCSGCAAVAEAIDKAGLSDYYRHRTGAPRSPQELIPTELEQLAVYDHDEIQKTFVKTGAGSHRTANLVLEGIQCAACVWLNERHLKSLPGIEHASINYSTHQAEVTWDNDEIHLSDILAAIRAIGYEAHPYDPDRRQMLLERQRRRLLRQLGAAAAIGMQVMIMTVALYAGEWYGMEPEFEQFFRKFSLLLTIPVLLYSGQDFFRNAWRDLRLRRISMDVPVSIGIGLAFAASAINVAEGEGAIYFESVCMFVLFLLAARYFELISRSRAMVAAESIAHIKPASARRLSGGTPDGALETVAAVDLRPGDMVRVLPGDLIPVDGVVVSGRSGVDESVLTGESAPLARGPGDPVIGGSINTESPLLVRVTRTGEETVLAEIHRLLTRATSHKPMIAQLADRVAAYFVAAVLGISSCVALFWIHLDSPEWLAITVSVLVVSCPCALSMAVPTALSSSIAALMRGKILVTAERALETLPAVTMFVFDKTGTLTLGQPQVCRIDTFGPQTSACLGIAAALESASEHPLARAIRGASPDGADEIVASDLINRPGAGVIGTIAGKRYWLGSRQLIAEDTRARIPNDDGSPAATEVLLADTDRVLCRFAINDQLRPGAAATIEALRARNLKTVLLSGDNRQAAEAIAAPLGFDRIVAECGPDQKLAQVRQWQEAGEVVAMVGDGVNDAPVLAGADVSISAGGATSIAVASADIVVLSHDVRAIVRALETSVDTLRIMKQNLFWAAGYNLIAIPAAAAGMVAPWLAALGMSLSSLIVIGNASRLRRRRTRIGAEPPFPNDARDRSALRELPGRS